MNLTDQEIAQSNATAINKTIKQWEIDQHIYLTTEQRFTLIEEIIEYAFQCVIDSTVRKENMDIILQYHTIRGHLK